MPHGTAYEGQFYAGRFKTRQSQTPIPVPNQVRPVIEAWRGICNDTSPEALMFPTFGCGEVRGKRCRAGARTSSSREFVPLPKNSASRIASSPSR